MKKVVSFFICLIMVLTVSLGMTCSAAYATHDPIVTGTGAVVYCATTDEVLWAKNEHEAYNPASITKLLTCLIAVEQLGLDAQVTVAKEATQISRYKAEVHEGEIISVEELVYKCLMISANDAAKALAIAVSGDEESFSKLMNDKCAKIGCKNSHFNNASGIAENGNTASAMDIVLIAKTALSNEDIRRIAGTKKHTVPKTNKSEKEKLEAGNLLLTGGMADTYNGKVKVEKYPGVFGGKTGTTNENKATMVVGMETQGLEVYVVTLNSTLGQRYNDMKHMMDYAKDVINPYTVLAAGTEFEKAKIKCGATNRVTGMINEDIIINLPEGASASLVTTEVKYQEKIKAPIAQGQVIGTIDVFLAGEKMRSIPVTAKEEIKKGWFLSALGITNLQTIFILIGILMIFVVFVIIMRVRARNIRKRNLERQEKIRKMAMEEMKKQEDWEKRGWTYHK